MKNVLFAIAIIASVSSCTKDKNQISKTDTEKPSTEIQVAIIDPKITTAPIQQPNATYNFLGFGYDVTDRYDDSHSVREAVIDLPLFVAQNPARFDLSRSTQSYWTNNSAVDAADFAYQLSNSLSETKGYKLFKNSLSAKFNAEDIFDKKYIYGSYILISQLNRLKINFSYEGSNYLTSSFKNDMNTFIASELVKKYGTHVLRDIKLGAKLSVFYQAQTESDHRKNVSATGLRYAMKKLFGLPTGELDPMDLYALNANANAKIYYELTGGDKSKLEKMSINGYPFINITNWSRSLTLENAEFINVDENGLIPLYELIEDTQKKAIVKDYIVKYILENQALTK